MQGAGARPDFKTMANLKADLAEESTAHIQIPLFLITAFVLPSAQTAQRMAPSKRVKLRQLSAVKSQK
jgi:hypothetical protein